MTINNFQRSLVGELVRTLLMDDVRARMEGDFLMIPLLDMNVVVRVDTMADYLEANGVEGFDMEDFLSDGEIINDDDTLCALESVFEVSLVTPRTPVKLYVTGRPWVQPVLADSTNPPADGSLMWGQPKVWAAPVLDSTDVRITYLDDRGSMVHHTLKHGEDLVIGDDVLPVHIIV